MRSTKSIIFAVIAIVVISWLGYTFWLAYQPKAERFQGQIEAQQYLISSKVPGRIDQVLVKKGDEVQQGQQIFTLLSPEIEAKLAQAKAAEGAAGAMANQAKTGARSQEIAAAQESVA